MPLGNPTSRLAGQRSSGMFHGRSTNPGWSGTPVIVSATPGACHCRGNLDPVTTYDVLGGPGRDAPRRVPRRLLAVLALLAALAWSGDRLARARELDRLVTAARTTEVVVGASAESLRSLREYQSAALGGRGSPALRASLFGNLGHDAARWTPQVDERRRAVAAVSVLPWHSGLRRARAAYLARVRVESVKQMLLNPHARMSEAAFAAGFQSLSQFNRVFHRIVGEPPSSYHDRLHPKPRVTGTLVSLRQAA